MMDSDNELCKHGCPPHECKLCEADDIMYGIRIALLAVIALLIWFWL